MGVISTILGLITAHLLGDYVFQSEYIAKTKKNNIYHLIVHCWIYTFCFWGALTFFNKMNFAIILFIFITHFIIDYLKCKFSDKVGGKKAYVMDQVFHYGIIFVVVMFLI